MTLTTRRLSPLLITSLLALAPPSLGWAQTGVDDDRVSLPRGPGSLEGVGDDVELDPNMGAMSYSVPIDLPKGFPRATPSLALSYSSAAGSGPVGIGWSMSLPAVGRMTSRGAPDYDTEDLFDVGGSELVRVGTDGGDLVYRARFEKAFVRYRWVGAGAEGYWVAESPDGSRSYFGADAQGNLQASARRTRPQGGTAEYALVETVDPYGHSVRYTYATGRGTVPLLTGISWLDDGAGNNLYSVAITYEARPDLLSDAGRGYEEITADRVSRIQVKNGASTIREYALTYEDDTVSGGFTRLASVAHYGLGGELVGDLHPVLFRFGYSQALGVQCTGAECDRPYLVEMGRLSGGIDIASGRATLVDINGDSLPDVLDTSDSTGHSFQINTLTPDGSGGFTHGFGAASRTAVAGTGSVQLGGSGRVQVFDVNGDGRADLLDAGTGAWLENGGDGDWAGSRTFADVSDITGLDFGITRFIDIDDDKRVDLISSTSQVTTVYGNEGDHFTTRSVDPLGVALGSGNVQFADINGDGLNDPVQINSSGTVRYRLNFGRGDWSEGWRTIGNLTVSPTDVALATLEDLNGDNVDDLVIVGQSTIQYAINRNGDRFDPFVTVSSADVQGDLPQRTTGVTVLFADMNANGSRDVVWFTSDGLVRYLELFPRRPNLMTRVSNGIGSEQVIRYTTAAEAEATARAAGTPWTRSLPIPMQMVTEIDRYVTLTGSADGTGLHELTTVTYRDGFYDGVEKQYRGFERVETTVMGDDFQEESRQRYTYDVGRDAPHRNGLVLTSQTLSDGRILEEKAHTYEDCAVAGVPSPAELEAQGRNAVYFPCATAEETTHKEGLTNSSDWKTVRTEMSYDGYGNVTLEARLGVIGVTGDELYTETEYVAPAARWQLNLPSRVRVYDAPGISDYSETLTYYDGAPFVGLPLGQADEGFVSRETKKVDTAGTTLEATRARHDAHGNQVEIIDPNGTIDDATRHRRVYTYDETGYFLITTDLAVGDHGLRRESRYERDFQKVAEATQWMLVEGGQVVSNRDSSSYRYDTFGRLSAEILPGDAPSTPSRVYEYDLADPMSQIRLQARSTTNGPLDEETFTCLDGRGRNYQMRTKIADGRYQVSGFTAYNARGVPVKSWQPWVSSEGRCDLTVPSDTLFTAAKFDALGRLVETTQPGAAIYGDDIVSRSVFLPLTTEAYDFEDNAAGGAHAETPLITTRDGLDRVVAIERTLHESGGLVRSGEILHYDSTGTFSGYTNAEGHRHLITTDLLGRTVAVTNPNLGTVRYAYDDASMVVSVTDARGVMQQREYDGQNRIVARYDVADREGSQVEWHYDVRPDFCAATECTNLPGRLAATTYPIRLVDGTVIDGVDAHGYDVRRRQVFSGRSFGERASLPTRIAYDNQDRIVSTTSPDGTVVERAYDAAGREVTLPGFVTEVTYDDRGLQSGWTLNNGASTRLGFDDLLRLASVRHTDATDAAFHDLELSRNRIDTITEVTDRAAAGLDLSARFAIDDWYRASSATYAEKTETFEMDALDRILSQNGAAIAYAADRPLAATSMGALTMTYDAAGNLTARNGMELGRDELGRISVITNDGVTSGVQAFAATDRVLQMTADGTLVLYGFDRYEVRDGVSTTFVSLGNSRVARSERVDVVTGFYPDANDNARIDAGDALSSSNASHVLAAAAARLLVEAEDAVAYLHADHLGNLVAATDASGALRGQQAFLLHGATRAEDGYVGAYGFTGQERDATTGLVHMMFRDLDPMTGRWDSFDPSFVRVDAEAMSAVGQAATGYAYVANGASTMTDPSGLEGGPPAGGGAKKSKYGKVRTALGAHPGPNNHYFPAHERWANKNAKNGVQGGNIEMYIKKNGKIGARVPWGDFIKNWGNGGRQRFFQSLTPGMIAERSVMEITLNRQAQNTNSTARIAEAMNARAQQGPKRPRRDSGSASDMSVPKHSAAPNYDEASVSGVLD